MRDVGIGVRKVKHQGLHEKVFVPTRHARLSANNLIAISFDDRREFAIHVKEANVVDRLRGDP